MESSRLSVRIYGRVQGVGFRFFTREVAEEMGLVGYVRNLPDGGVEVVAEGSRGRLEEFLALLKRGPRTARATRTEVSWETATDQYDGFRVLA